MRFPRVKRREVGAWTIAMREPGAPEQRGATEEPAGPQRSHLI